MLKGGEPGRKGGGIRSAGKKVGKGEAMTVRVKSKIAKVVGGRRTFERVRENGKDERKREERGRGGEARAL